MIPKKKVDQMTAGVLQSFLAEMRRVGLTVREVSQITQISTPTVQRWVNREQPPRDIYNVLALLRLANDLSKIPDQEAADYRGRSGRDRRQELVARLSK